MSETRPLLVVAHAVGAVGAGMLVDWGLDLRPVFGMTQFEPEVLIPSVMAVVAALVAFAPRAFRFAPGWTVAALGGVLALAVQQLSDFPVGGLTGWLLVVAIAVGLVLGGALLALGAETGIARLVIAAGVVAGVLLRPTVIDLLLRYSPPTDPVATPDRLLAYGVATVLIAVAVTQGVMERMRPTAAPTVSRDPLVTAAGIAAVAVAAVVVNFALTGVIDRSPTFGKLDLPIGSSVAAVNLIASTLLAALVAAALAWLAYRRGGIDAARWTVTGAAVALPLAYLPDSAETGPTLVVAGVLVGVTAGAAGAWLADRFGPWDLVGALLCAVTLLLTNPRIGDTMVPSWAEYEMLIIGVGLTLGAGLVRLARRTVGGEGPGFVERATPGFAAIILVGQVLVSLSVRSYASGVLAYGLPLTVVMFAVVLLVLFGLGRRMEARIPRESSVG